MKRMSSKCYAWFVLIGDDLDPKEVTARTGVIPAQTWWKGDLITPRGTIRYKHNGWKVQSQKKFIDCEDEDANDLAEHINEVLTQLRVGWQPLVEMGVRYHAEFCCIVYTSGDRPAIHFDCHILNQLSELNAELGVDLYVLPED